MTDCNVIHSATDDDAHSHQFGSGEDKLDFSSQINAVAVDESNQSCWQRNQVQSSSIMNWSINRTDECSGGDAR